MKEATGRDNLVWAKPLHIALVALFCFLILSSFIKKASADEFSSSNFVDQDPVILSEGGRSTSTNFELISGTSQNDIGESTSTNFGYHSGFFYFPLITTPVLGATAGDSLVQLSWSASIGSLGFNVGGYQVGQSTALSGPFTYSNVGNVLSSSRTALINSTAYYFVVRTLDFFGTPIVSSSLVVATPISSAVPSAGAGFFSSGGGSIITSTPSIKSGAVKLSGSSAPNDVVTILKNGLAIASITSDQNGFFATILDSIPLGTIVLSLYATDQNGLRSAPSTFVISIEPGKTFVLSNIFLSPKVTTDDESIGASDATVISGTSVPNSVITIFIEGKKNIILETITDSFGRYQVTISGKSLPLGTYHINVRSKKNNVISNTSRSVDLQIGTKTISRESHATACPATADFTGDCRVDLVDFSLLLYWFNHTNPPSKIDLNSDGIVNITDFSILIYYWTG